MIMLVITFNFIIAIIILIIIIIINEYYSSDTGPWPKGWPGDRVGYAEVRRETADVATADVRSKERAHKRG